MDAKGEKSFRQERWRKNQLENNREQFYERQREAYKKSYRHTRDAETKHDARLQRLNYKISIRIWQAKETETVIVITETLRK
jgi:hypothetical protein